jgi:hypothetical protein
MMYGLKPFNGAEMRAYLDILNEAPDPQAPQAGVAPQPTAQQAADLGKGPEQVAQAANKFSQGNYAGGAMDAAKGINATANAAGMSTMDKIGAVGTAVKAAGAAGLAHLRGKDPVAAATGSVVKNVSQPVADYTNSPNYYKDFKAGVDAARNNPSADPRVAQMATDVDAGKISADSMKDYANRMQNKAERASSGETVDFDDNPYIQHSGLKTADTAELDAAKTAAMTGKAQPVQEDELTELRRYFDMIEAAETPTGAGQFSTKQMDDGTKVSFDPVAGGKTVSGAAGTTNYNVAGQKTSSQTPSIKGFQQSTNYQTGEKTTTGQVGPVGISATQRPDQSTVTTAEVPLGADVTAKTSRGIGFGGAGKDVQQGGNQVSSITTRTAQNPQGTTSSFVGKPTAQYINQALESKVTSPDLPKKGLNQQQKSVNQMPALFKPKGIKVLGNKKDPDHPAKGYFVGANESEQMMAAEDMLGKIRRDLTDYLRSVEDEIGGRDRSLTRKAKHDIMTPKLAQLVPAKTMYTDDGKEIKIHGNQDDGFRITVREKTLPSTFDSLEEAAMACEMYCAHRRGRYNEADSDYLDERDTDIV